MQRTREAACGSSFVSGREPLILSVLASTAKASIARLFSLAIPARFLRRAKIPLANPSGQVRLPSTIAAQCHRPYSA